MRCDGMIAAIRAGNPILGKKIAAPPAVGGAGAGGRIGRSNARKADAVAAAASDLILNFHSLRSGELHGKCCRARKPQSRSAIARIRIKSVINRVCSPTPLEGFPAWLTQGRDEVIGRIGEETKSKVSSMGFVANGYSFPMVDRPAILETHLFH